MWCFRSTLFMSTLEWSSWEGSLQLDLKKPSHCCLGKFSEYLLLLLLPLSVCRADGGIGVALPMCTGWEWTRGACKAKTVAQAQKSWSWQKSAREPADQGGRALRTFCCHYCCQNGSVVSNSLTTGLLLNSLVSSTLLHTQLCEISA